MRVRQIYLAAAVALLFSGCNKASDSAVHNGADNSSEASLIGNHANMWPNNETDGNVVGASDGNAATSQPDKSNQGPASTASNTGTSPKRPSPKAGQPTTLRAGDVSITEDRNGHARIRAGDLVIND